MKVTGGLVGLAAVPGLGMAQEGSEASTQQGPSDKRIGMLSTAGEIYSAPFLWVEPGTAVVWELVGGSHSATAYAESNDKPSRIPADASGWDSGILSEPGATFRRTFDVPGVYDYYCTPHESLGMVGRLVVGSPDIANEPALAEPQSSLPEAVREVLSGLNAATRVMFG